MTEDFIAHMEGAIAAAPNEKIAGQLQMLLDRLRSTGGEVPKLPGVDR